MNRTFGDIREFIKFLEEKEDIIKVKREVDPDLEINEILDRLAKTKGPAVLFENVKGSDIPLFGNAFGTHERMSAAFGCADFSEHVENLADELTSLFSAADKELFLSTRKKSVASKTMNIVRIPRLILKALKAKKVIDPLLPVEIPRSKAPCKEVILTGKDINLKKFPLIKCWPQDGGRYITLPLIVTRDPETRGLNLGIYRMMMLNEKSLCMHWLPQKHGNQHHAKYEKLNKEMPVAVSIGADPALEVSGVFALAPPVDEFMISGLLKGSPTEYTKAEDSDLWVPAGAEIVFEGVIRPNERADEGPYGEFHGYYSPVKQTPVFHVEKITMRKKPIWHAATTGMPPTEIHVFSKAAERVAAVGLKMLFPGVVDINMTRESGTLYTHIIAFDKKRPYEAQELMHFLWSIAPQSPYITNIIVVDADIDIHDLSKVLWAVSVNFRPEHDLMITPAGLADLERPSTYPRGVGGHMGIDATTKWASEGLLRSMPDKVVMDTKITEKVESQWKEYGF